jgi:hypothetical protein
MIFRVLTLLILLCCRADAMMPMLGSGAVNVAGCSCEDNTGTDEKDTAKAICSSRLTVSQSFAAPASGTNVTIKWKSGSDVNDTPAPFTVYLDDDRDFSADTLGSQTGNVGAASTEYCVEITSSGSLTASSTYYFLISGNDATYDERYTVRLNVDDYADGTYCSVEGTPPSLDHTSGTSCPAGEDLYFKVCVGADCSCD